MLKFKKEVDLDEELKGWKQDNLKYEMTSIMDEYCYVYKNSRSIEQYGYNGTVMWWLERGLLEM